MNNNTMLDLLNTLKRLQDQALPIQLYNEEVYKKFAERIEHLEQELISLEDDSKHDDPKSMSLVADVTSLEFDLTLFLQTGRLEQVINPFEESKKVSGNEMQKRHVLDIYKQLVQVLRQMTSIDINRLKQLKEQWDKEKEKGIYSAAETNAMEKELANAYIEYQIKTCSNEGKLPKEPKDDFCLPEVYEQEFKKRVVEHITSLPKGSIERIQLESLFLNWDIDKIIKNGAVWRALSGIEPEIPLEELIEKATQELAKTTPQQENPNNLPLDVNGPTRGNAVLIVYEKQLPDGTIQRKKKVKELDPKGRFRIFFNKDQVVELHFLEGTRELSFTKNGNTKSSVDSLSNFPNLRAVHIPSTVRFIEQGYFLNCANLKTVSLATGICYKPSPMLFPETAKIVESEEKADKSVVINELDEQAAIFSQLLPNGSYRTIKVPLEDGSFLPKSFTNKAKEGIEEVRFTHGTKDLGEQSWSSDYDPQIERGGKFSHILGLKKVFLPEDFDNIGINTFKDCTTLETVVMQPGLKRIQRGSFEGCISLRNVEFKDGIEEIGDRAFNGCISLTSVVLPESAKTVGRETYMDCEGIEKVEFPSEFKKIGANAFKNCSGIKEVKLPTKSIRTIEEGAFQNCTNIKQIALPTEVTELKKDAFQNCRSVNVVSLPKKYDNIEEAFGGCDGLECVVVPKTIYEVIAMRMFGMPKEVNFLVGREWPDGIEPGEFLESNYKKHLEAQTKANTPPKQITKSKDDREEI